MKKKNTGILVIGIILAALALFFVVLGVSYAFEFKFAVDLEWHIITKWGWSGFNLLLWSLLGMFLMVAIEIIVLVVSEDKQAKANQRTRRQNKYFE